MHDHPWKQTKLRNLKAYSYEELLAMENGHPGPTSSRHGPYIVGGDSDDVGLRMVNSKDFPKGVSPRPCVVDMLVPEKAVTSIYGTSGVVKSTLVLDLLLCASRGDATWLGRRLGGTYKSVFVDFELDLEEQAKRSRQLCWGRGYEELPENMNYIGGRGRTPASVFNLAYDRCKEEEITLVAIDSAGMAMTGDAGKYRDVVDFFQHILDAFTVNLGCTIILIDHQANVQAGESYQTKAQFGSSYKGNLSRSRIQMQLQESSKGVRRLTLRHNKANFTDYVEPFDVTVRFMGHALTLEAETMDVADLAQEGQLPAWKRALLILYKENDPMVRHNIAAAVGVSHGTVGNALTNLRKREFIRDCGRGPDGTNPVEITPKGTEFVEEFLSAYTDDIITSHPPYRDRDDDDVPNDVGDDSEASVERADGLWERTYAVPENDPVFVDKGDDLGEVHEWIQTSEILGVDIETTGLDPENDRICLIQLSDGEKTFVLDALALDLRSTVRGLRKPRIVAHNAKFEAAFIQATYGVELEIEDTIFLVKILEQGTRPDMFTDSNKIENVVARYHALPLPKTDHTSDWTERPLTEDQILYAAEDAEVLVPLYAALLDGIEQNEIEEVLDIECRCAPAFRWMEETGVFVDVAKLRERMDELQKEAQRLHKRLQKHSEINWGSPDQLREFFGLEGKKDWPLTGKTKRPSTKTEHLGRLKHPAIPDFVAWKRAQKTLSSFGERWMKMIGEDGRLHSKYGLLTTVTGRTECSSPNIQQTPRESPHRECITAPEGRVLIKADYSQIELRIAAKYAPDENLLGLYQDGNVDVHTRMAAAITDKPESRVTKAERNAAKAANFGPLYGMGAKRLVETARKSYGVDWDLDKAKAVLKTFKQSYPGIASWHRDGYTPHNTNRSELAPTRTYAGRRRTHFKSVMDWFNTPIQGTGADGAKLAMALLYERRDEVPSLAPVIFVHDEIVVECDEADAEAAREHLIRCMVDGMNAVLNKDEPRVPVVVEAKVTKSWA
jgi:DNA polymerase-1